MRSAIIMVPLLLSTALTSRGENLLVNGGFETSVTIPTGIPTGFGYWSHDISAIVSGPVQGIQPYAGNNMLHFTWAGMSYSADGGACELYQLVDLEPHASIITTGRGVASASAFFNRVLGNVQTDTMFGLDIRVYTGAPSTFATQIDNSELAITKSWVLTDGDIGTWQSVNPTLILPSNADFLAVRLWAGENVFDDSTLPEFDGHYADEVSVIITPEPATLCLLGLGGLVMKRRRAT